MTLSMYEASTPVFLRGLTNLSAILDKAEAHAQATALPPEVLIEARLIDDMEPLRSQVQRASDSAKGCAARLAGIVIPSFLDTETSFEELQERIAKTAAFLNSVEASQINDSEQREVTINSRRSTMIMDGKSYLLQFALPNFFFHVTTAYAILRHRGVQIGKMDYLGTLGTAA